MPADLEPELAARALAALQRPLVICDAAQPDTPVVYANPAFQVATGYPQETILGCNLRMLQGEATDPAAVEKMRQAIRGQHNFRDVLLNYHQDGSPFWNDMSFTPVRNPAGTVTHWVSLQEDVSERVEEHEALRAAATRLETVIGSLQAGVIVEDDHGQVVLVNQSFCDMMGFEAPPEMLVGANVVPMARRMAVQFIDPDAFIQRAREIRQRQEPVQAEELWLADRRVWERDYVPMFSDEAATGGYRHGGHLWVFRDVTERRRLEQQAKDAAIVLEFQKNQVEQANAALEQVNAALEQVNFKMEQANAKLEALATRDGLTGLLNHRVFSERLAEEFLRARRYQEPLSLIILDVDRFKAYNDSLGHLAGNAVLRELGEVLREHARETDLAARFGGEEFALILPHTDQDEAVALADRLRAAVEGRAWSASYPVTASFGVCGLTPSMADPDELIACADAALYRAKAGGRNKVEAG